MATLAVCPHCSRELQVPEALIGQAVRCPACATTFSTSPEGIVDNVVPPASAPPAGPEPVPQSTSEASEPAVPLPGRVSQPRKSWGDERTYRRRDVEPHRGTMILVLGILAVVVAPIILGPIAWILGNADMKKIRAGTMDPQGEGHTNAGRIIGIVATIYGLVSCLCGIVALGFWIAMMLTVTPPAAPPRPPGPPQNPMPGRRPPQFQWQFPRRPLHDGYYVYASQFLSTGTLAPGSID